MSGHQTAKRISDQVFWDISPSYLVIKTIEKVEMIFNGSFPRFNDPAVPVTWVCTISEIPLINPSEVIPRLRKALAQVSASAIILPVAMHEVYYSFPPNPLFRRVEVILYLHILVVVFLDSPHGHRVDHWVLYTLEVDVPRMRLPPFVCLI